MTFLSVCILWPVGDSMGLNSGFMIPQYTAAALVSENKVFAHPASVDSIPSSLGQEDHVSMGATSALKASRVVRNARMAVAIEMLAAEQARALKVKPEVVLAMIDAASRAQFEPARAGGAPVAVSMVWLLAHTTVVVMAPGMGDEVQAIKAGILEVADMDAARHAIARAVLGYAAYLFAPKELVGSAICVSVLVCYGYSLAFMRRAEEGDARSVQNAVQPANA